MIAIYIKPRAGIYRRIRESKLFSKKFCFINTEKGLAVLPGKSGYFKTGNETIYHPEEVLEGDFDLELKEFIIHNMDIFN